MKVFIPKSLQEAVSFLKENQNFIPFAGGTDLMPLLAKEVLSKKNSFIDLNNLTEELSFINLQEDGNLWIGSLATIRKLCENHIIAEHFPLIAASAINIGSVQIRNLATIGGNIANASPAADLIPALLVHDSSLILTSDKKTRQIDLKDYYVSYKRTSRKPYELITGIIVKPLEQGRILFRKIGNRRNLSLSKIVVSSYIAKEFETKDPCRFAAGSVKEIPARLSNLEESVINRRISESELRNALLRDISPINDVRSTCLYRTEVLLRVIRKFIEWK